MIPKDWFPSPFKKREEDEIYSIVIKCTCGCSFIYNHKEDIKIGERLAFKFMKDHVGHGTAALRSKEPK